MLSSHYSLDATLLVWVFHNRSLNNRINKLQERALRLLCKDATLFFNELLEEENTLTIYQINIQNLAIKMYKIKYKKALTLIRELLQETEHPYNLRIDHTFRTFNVENGENGTEKLSFKGSEIREMVFSYF